MDGAKPVPVIRATGLTKRYGRFTAVDGLDLTVKGGEVFGLLGPNGSGKTTTILMLLGLTERSSGSVTIMGLDPAREPLAVKRAVGYLPDAVGFYDDLTAAGNLRYSAQLLGLRAAEAASRIAEVLGRLGLTEVANQRVSTFSRGMRQRLGLADVLLKRPHIAILDEPTASLDPQAAHEFLGLIFNLRSAGITVLLSSHLLPHVQSVCDRVGLFRRGKLVLEGSVPELAARVLGSAYTVAVEARGTDLGPLLMTLPGVTHVTREGEDHYRVAARADIRPQIASRVTGAGADLYNLHLAERSLDEVYAQTFKGSLDVAA